MKKDSFAWECPKCGHRHFSWLRAGDPCTHQILMKCDKCRGHTWMWLSQIGRRAFVGSWARFEGFVE